MERRASRTGPSPSFAFTSGRLSKAAKITGKVGWHTFRHSLATILKSHGEDVTTCRSYCGMQTGV
jgi:site-specific recombinase XerD